MTRRTLYFVVLWFPSLIPKTEAHARASNRMTVRKVAARESSLQRSPRVLESGAPASQPRTSLSARVSAAQRPSFAAEGYGALRTPPVSPRSTFPRSFPA